MSTSDDQDISEDSAAAPDSDVTNAESASDVTEQEDTRVASEADAGATPPHGDELSDAVAEAAADTDAPADEPAVAADDSDDEGASGPFADADDETDEADEADEGPAAAPRRRRLPGRRRGGDSEAAKPEKPAGPTPSRRRARRDPNAPAPVVRAQAKYVRSSARKARLVCDHIRGKSVVEARAILAVTPRAIAKDWSKLLESAVANAEHNHELVGEDLYVKAVHADEGPTIKRFRPRAMGRATRIRKRTSHLTILLTPKD
jgi:ribosomal protein L22